MRIGILALQGDFEAHSKMLQRMGISFIFVTHPKHLSGLRGLILPGGESTTLLKFLEEDDFFSALKQFAEAGRCLFGTCAGAILLAKKVIKPSQHSLKLVDVTIERNAYGRQLASHIGVGNYLHKKQNLEMVFIRAPRILQLGPSVNIFATYQDQPVGVIEDRVMLTTFHPELTSNTAIHQLFIEKCEAWQ
jgi:5'-phosphate synthase pdxT subunit